MAKVASDVCDARCQLFHSEMIRKENAIRMKWFLKNQQRLIDQLREPKFIKRAKEIITEPKKREAARVDKPIICNYNLLIYNHLFKILYICRYNASPYPHGGHLNPTVLSI